MSMCLFFSLVYVSVNNKYFLSTLVLFEFVSLSIFMELCYLSGVVFNCMGLYFCVVFLTVSVCEAVLGLSILVSNARSSGSKMVKSFSLMDL